MLPEGHGPTVFFKTSAHEVRRTEEIVKHYGGSVKFKQGLENWTRLDTWTVEFIGILVEPLLADSGIFLSAF